MPPPDEQTPTTPAPPEPEYREADLRRADFRGGEPVTMADGQDWILPKPLITITATDDAIGFANASDMGPGFDALLQEMEEAKTDRQLYSAFCRITATLLRWNYDLPPGLLPRLVRISRGGFWQDAIVQAVMRIAQGYDGPKPSGGGGG